jgi:hypothetical protein
MATPNGGTPRWRNDVRPIVGAARAQPVISWIAAGAFAAAVTRQGLLEVPELVPGGAASGEFVSGLSLAIVAAWIFNLAVVAVPRQRNEDLLLLKVAPDLMEISGAARRVLGRMSSVSGIALPAQVALNDVETICGGVGMQTTGPGVTTWRNKGPEQMTWWEYIHWEVAGTIRLHERIAAVYVFLPGELVVLLREHADADYVRLITDQLGNTPLANPDLGAFALDLFDYVQLCDRLRAYLDAR